MKFINLKKFRKDRNLKQKTLVAQTGLQQSVVSYLENGYQEVTEMQLNALQKAYPDVDFEEYVYEQDGFPVAAAEHRPFVHTHRQYHGDWNKPTPLDNIQGHSILVKMGRINITGEGDLFLDKNDGTFSAIGYYHIPVKRLSDNHLLHSLTRKTWFDDEMYEHFKRCYALACSIAGVSSVNQDN